MGWRTGSKLFAEMWPLIQAHITDREHRIEFTAHLLKDDMDAFDVEDIHPDGPIKWRARSLLPAPPA